MPLAIFAVCDRCAQSRFFQHIETLIESDWDTDNDGRVLCPSCYDKELADSPLNLTAHDQQLEQLANRLDG